MSAASKSPRPARPSGSAAHRNPSKASDRPASGRHHAGSSSADQPRQERQQGSERAHAKPRNRQQQSVDALQKPWVKPSTKSPTKSSAGQKNQVVDAANKTVSAAVLKQHRLEEAKVQGENACRVCFVQRPEALVKMYLNAAMAPKFADVMKYLAANKKAYHLVDDAELEKITGSSHHGGVVLVVKRKQELSLASYLAANKQKKQDCLLALDGVGNPHNLGAIARSCAHFGVAGIVMTEPDLLQSGAAARTAEGGLEFISGLSCDNLPLALQLCKQAGYSLITTSSHACVSLYQSKLPAKVVVVFGEEMDGVSSQVANSTDVALQIPGTGRVESLNVSVAASLILGEWYRQQQ